MGHTPPLSVPISALYSPSDSIKWGSREDGERNLTAWSRPLFCPVMPQTSGGKDKVISQMSKEVSKSLHKANLTKAHLWGVREGLVKSHFLDFIHGSLAGCHSAAKLSDQDWKWCIPQLHFISQGKWKPKNSPLESLILIFKDLTLILAQLVRA